MHTNVRTDSKLACYVLMSLALISTSHAQQQGESIIPTHTTANDTIAWHREWIEGFATSPSVKQGEMVQFKISTLAALDPSTHSVTAQLVLMDIYRAHGRSRLGTGDTLVASTSCMVGFYPLKDIDNQPIYPGDYSRHPYDYRRGCNEWAVAKEMQANWRSGFYYAKLRIAGDARIGYIPFVVRAADTSTTTTLCVFSWNTYQAYNYWGGGSLYYWTGTFESPDTAHTTGGVVSVIHTVSFRRPFTTFFESGYPYTTQLGQYDHHERAFVAWAEENNYPVDYCVDADLLRADSLQFFNKYKAVVFPGHSEYWTRIQRENMEKQEQGSSFKAVSANLAFLSANICYWMVDYRPNPNTRNPDSMFCNKNHNGAWWRNQPIQSGVGGHEARLIGVEYKGNNGIVIIRSSDTTSYGPDRRNRVRNDQHWLFKETPLHNGMEFGYGAGTNSFWTSFDPLVSGESDMLDLNHTPPNKILLADTTVRPLFQPEDPHYDEVTDHTLRSQMTMYEDTITNSRVFAAGAFGWPTSLFGEDSTTMRAMHRSLLDHFSGKKYIGNVYTTSDLPLLWDSNIELDGNVNVLSGKKLRIISSTATVDSGVIFEVNGSLEITGNVTIIGQNNKWGELVVRNSGTLTVKAGATLNLVAPLFFVLQTGSNLVLEPGATVNLRTSTSLGTNAAITVPAGATVNVTPPAEIFFGSNARLVAYGRLNAIGTPSSRITFTANTASPTRGYWGGIQLNNGPSEFRYCTILYAGNGITVNNTSTNLIDNCIIQECSGQAILGYNNGQYNGTLSILNSALTHNNRGLGLSNARADVYATSLNDNSWQGVYAMNGLCYFTQSTIENNSYSGLRLSGLYAMAYFGDDWASPGYNIVTNNNASLGQNESEIGIGNDAALMLGVYDSESLLWGMNSVFYGSNFVTGQKLVDNQTSWYYLWAHQTYWGTKDKPPSSYFGGQVDYDFWLTEPPVPVNRPILAMKGNAYPLTSGNGMPDTLALMRFADRLIRFVGDNPDSARRELKLLSSLVGQGSMLGEGYVGDWENYLSRVQALVRSRRMRELCAAMRVHAAVRRGAFNTATSLADSVLTHNPSDETWFSCQTSKIMASLGQRDTAQARTILESIRARANRIDSFAVNLLGDIIKHATTISSSSSLSQSNSKLNSPEGTVTMPSEFVLDRNYPNPFNPTTTIKFALPENSNISLIVYDVLGRKVTELASGYHAAGYHSAMWNASGVASGVYFARFTATDMQGNVKLSKVSKLLLTK